MALRAPQAGARDAFDELAELWIVGINAPHDAGCACVGVAMASIAAVDIERDFLSYLAGKHKSVADLSAVIAARRQSPEGACERWIAGLGAAPLSPESSARLESDLRVFLESLGGRSKFAICY